MDSLRTNTHRDIYFDNAATMTKIPESIKAELDFYKSIDANPLRGVYRRSVMATELLENTRKKILEFIGGSDDGEIVFTKGATEALNLAADGVRNIISKDDLILVDICNHHSNILPWTERYTNAKIVDLVKNTEISHAKIIAICGMSNVTGENFIAKVRMIRKENKDAILVLDAAQLIAHADLAEVINYVDFVAFSGHKIGSPMGVGVLYIGQKIKQNIEPMNYGGEMVDAVLYENNSVKPIFSEGAQKFEAGTLNLGGICGLSKSIDFWNHIDTRDAYKRENELTRYLTKKMSKMQDVTVYAGDNGIITFNVKDVHPHDCAQILDQFGISVRAGFHCAQPFLIYKNWGPVVRVSLSIFSTKEEVDYFLEVLSKVRLEMGFDE